MKDSQIQVLIFHEFCKRRLPTTLHNGTQFLHPVLVKSQAKANVPHEMSVPSSLHAQLNVHKIVQNSTEVDKKKLKTIVNEVNSTLTHMRLQLVQKI